MHITKKAFQSKNQ